MQLWKHPAIQAFGNAAGHLGKGTLRRLFDLILAPPQLVRVEELRDVRRVLLVRPNFRIGNTLLTTPLVPALRQRFPGARIDYLGADTTASLLAGSGVEAVYCVSRRFILRPWQFAALLLRLRRRRYDVAVEGGMGSFSGALYAYLAGARYRIGCRGRGERMLNVRLAPEPVTHAYDGTVSYARALGVSCPNRPLYEVTADEREAARALLGAVGLARNGAAVPFLALFAGGHRHKRWPAERWIELAACLAKDGARFVVFLGPEEMGIENRLRRFVQPATRVIPPQPLRTLAAVCAHARLLVTADSGPMHLAAALGVPTIALVQAQTSLHYCPRREDDLVLIRPSAQQVEAAIRELTLWRKVAS